MPTDNIVSFPPQMGFCLANIAIDILERIPADDADREDAVDLVRNWCASKAKGVDYDA